MLLGTTGLTLVASINIVSMYFGLGWLGTCGAVAGPLAVFRDPRSIYDAFHGTLLCSVPLAYHEKKQLSTLDFFHFFLYNQGK